MAEQTVAITRRSAMQGISALAATLALPASAAVSQPLKAARLRLGDTVGLIEPAGFSDDLLEVEGIANTIRAMGLVPKIGRHVAARHGYLAGTDEQRAADVNDMYRDPEVRAVFAIRGGWGSARILPLLDWKAIRSNPKLLIGYSDITALHLAFAARAGFPTIHGPNAANGWQEQSWNSLWSLAFNGDTPTLQNPPSSPEALLTPERWRNTPIHPGKAAGRLIGGNLSVLAALVGTPWLPNMDGAILFLEDIGEAEYRIDRMMTQLALSGTLKRLAGVVFGQCTRCTSDTEDYTGLTVGQVLHHHLAPLGIPAFYGANIGHVGNQLCIPVGVRAEMDADAGTIRVLEPVVV